MKKGDTPKHLARVTHVKGSSKVETWVFGKGQIYVVFRSPGCLDRELNPVVHCEGGIDTI